MYTNKDKKYVSNAKEYNSERGEEKLLKTRQKNREAQVKRREKIKQYPLLEQEFSRRHRISQARYLENKKRKTNVNVQEVGCSSNVTPAMSSGIDDVLSIKLNLMRSGMDIETVASDVDLDDVISIIEREPVSCSVNVQEMGCSSSVDVTRDDVPSTQLSSDSHITIRPVRIIDIEGKKYFVL